MSKIGRRGLMKILIISTILKHGRIHGYGIYKELTSRNSIEWNPSIGTIYRTLASLVSEEYLEKREETFGNRRVVYYNVTDKGLEEFKRVAKCTLNKVILGLEALVPALMTLRASNRVKSEFDSELSIIRDIVNTYFNGNAGE